MALELWKKLKTSLEHSLGGSVSSSTDETPAPTNPVQSVLGTLEAARKSALNYDDRSRDQQIKEEHRQAHLDEEKKLTQTCHEEMLDDILKLHTELGTGFHKADLEELSESLRSSIKFFSNRNTDSLADQGLIAILGAVHDEALEFGWQKLTEKLSSGNKAWPAPGGVSRNATEEEIQIKSELYVKQQRIEFLNYNLLVLADIIQGAVPAWRSVYPERHGSVWTSTCFQAVGGAFAAQRYSAAVNMGQSEVETLRSKVASRLAEAIKPIEAELKKGVTSLNQARMLSDDASRVCQEIAVEVFWEVVRPRLEATSAVKT